MRQKFLANAQWRQRSYEAHVKKSFVSSAMILVILTSHFYFGRCAHILINVMYDSSCYELYMKGMLFAIYPFDMKPLITDPRLSEMK